MRFPKLTPLQSRFAASLGASISLIVLYLILSSPRFAYASDVDPPYQGAPGHIGAADTEVPGVTGAWEPQPDELNHRGLEAIYGGDLAAREVPDGSESLGNNAPKAPNIDPGETQYYVFLKDDWAGEKSARGLDAVARAEMEAENDVSYQLRRQAEQANSTTTVYISLNTCLVPLPNSTETSNETPAPQLTVYISQSKSAKKPGPDTEGSDITTIEADGGYVGTTLEVDGDVFIGVSAPNTDTFSGVYNYEIAASIDAPFHAYDDETPNLYFVDGDSTAALLITNDTTQALPDSDEYKEWMDSPPPFTMFGQNTNDTSILGLHKSYCGLHNLAKISKITKNVEAGMTNRGIGQKPKEQFYITSLNQSSTYFGILAIEANSTEDGGVAGGGKVWKTMNFTTKAGMLFFPSHSCNLVGANKNNCRQQLRCNIQP
jgi:calcium channel MID1